MMKYQCVTRKFPTETPLEDANAAPRKNLDVQETFQDRDVKAAQGSEEDSPGESLLSVVSESGAERRHREARRYRPHGTKCLNLYQATNVIEAVDYTREIGRPLVAHATIHWSGTVAFDDHDGSRFAKLREGFHKYLLRRRIPGGLSAVWCRECRAHTDIVHCHLLFHLPEECRKGAKLLQIEAAIYRLVARHGDGILGGFAVKLTLHPDPDGLYIIKGGNREVWEQFRLRKEWRQSQGIVPGKRCGTTQNIGRAARRHAAAKRERA
jgi:hypothetical protein